MHWQYAYAKKCTPFIMIIASNIVIDALKKFHLTKVILVA